MIQTLGPPPTDTPLKVVRSEVVISENNPWVLWLNLIHEILKNVGPRWTKVTDVTFPPCPANNSVDVDVAFPGITPATGAGEIAPVIILGLSSNTQFTTGNGFYAFCRAADIVTIREFCCDTGGIGGFTDTFTITVLTGEPNVP